MCGGSIRFLSVCACVVGVLFSMSGAAGNGQGTTAASGSGSAAAATAGGSSANRSGAGTTSALIALDERLAHTREVSENCKL